MSTVAAPKTRRTASEPGSTGVLEADDFPARADRPLADSLLETSPPLPSPSRPGRKRRALLWILGCIALISTVAGTLYWFHAQRYESTDDATIEARIIPISPQIAARVKAVHIADNAPVRKGDLLIELDPTDYQVAVEQARASEAAARGRLAQAVAQVDSVRASRDEAGAEVKVAESNAQMAAADHDRYEDAARRNSGSISKQQLDNATAAWRSTDAQVQQARAKLNAAEAQIVTAQAAVQGLQGDLAKAAADVHRAEINLSYCTLRAPEDGRITRKNIEAGSYVQPGQNLFAIVPPEYWVVANFKETQLDLIRPGQTVAISVDAYPEREFTGTVESIQSGTGSRFSMLPTENATGNYVKVVQRIPIKIVFDAGQTQDPGHPLAAGMSAVPVVKVK